MGRRGNPRSGAAGGSSVVGGGVGAVPRRAAPEPAPPTGGGARTPAAPAAVTVRIGSSSGGKQQQGAAHHGNSNSRLPQPKLGGGGGPAQQQQQQRSLAAPRPSTHSSGHPLLPAAVVLPSSRAALLASNVATPAGLRGATQHNVGLVGLGADTATSYTAAATTASSSVASPGAGGVAGGSGSGGGTERPSFHVGQAIATAFEIPVVSSSSSSAPVVRDVLAVAPAVLPGIDTTATTTASSSSGSAHHVGWCFVATPYGGLWAWHPSRGTKTELIRDATAPWFSTPSADLAAPPPRRGHRSERGGAAPPLPSSSTPSAPPLPNQSSAFRSVPLYVPESDEDQRSAASASIRANAVAVVPLAASSSSSTSSSSMNTLAVVSIVRGQLHVLHVACTVSGASGVPIARVLSAGFVLCLNSPTTDTATTTTAAAAAAGGEDGPHQQHQTSVVRLLDLLASDASSSSSPPPIDTVLLNPAPGLRASSKRCAISLFIRGAGRSSERPSALHVLNLDAGRRSCTLISYAQPPSAASKGVGEIATVQWLGDADHHLVVIRNATKATRSQEVQLLAVSAPERTACSIVVPATTTATPPTTIGNTATNVPQLVECGPGAIVTRPEGSVTALHAATVGPGRHLVAVASGDNALQLLTVVWTPPSPFRPQQQLASPAKQVGTLVPVAGYVYPPTKELIDDVRVLDEEAVAFVTTTGRVAFMSVGACGAGVCATTCGPAMELVRVERLHARGLDGVEFDRVRLACRTERGLIVMLGNRCVAL